MQLYKDYVYATSLLLAWQIFLAEKVSDFLYHDCEQTVHTIPQLKWPTLLFLILLTCLGNNYSYIDLVMLDFICIIHHA